MIDPIQVYESLILDRLYRFSETLPTENRRFAREHTGRLKQKTAYSPLGYFLAFCNGETYMVGPHEIHTSLKVKTIIDIQELKETHERPKAPN